MSAEDVALIAIGMILNAGVFAGGILVGISLTRKDVRYDDSNKGTKEDTGWWHQPVSTGTQGGAQRRRPGGADQVATTHLPERAPFGRGAFWE